VFIIQQYKFHATNVNTNSSNTRCQMYSACTGACSCYCITNTSFRISNMATHIV